MLHQSYVHGSELHEKVIQEAFDCGYEYGMDDCEAQLASLQKSFKAECDKQHLEMLLNFAERCQESREEGIQEEQEHWELKRPWSISQPKQIQSPPPPFLSRLTI